MAIPSNCSHQCDLKYSAATLPNAVVSTPFPEQPKRCIILDEILTNHVFPYCSGEDLARTACVSRNWRVLSDKSSFWINNLVQIRQKTGLRSAIIYGFKSGFKQIFLFHRDWRQRLNRSDYNVILGSISFVSAMAAEFLTHPCRLPKQSTEVYDSCSGVHINTCLDRQLVFNENQEAEYKACLFERGIITYGTCANLIVIFSNVLFSCYQGCNGEKPYRVFRIFNIFYGTVLSAVSVMALRGKYDVACACMFTAGLGFIAKGIGFDTANHAIKLLKNRGYRVTVGVASQLKRVSDKVGISYAANKCCSGLKYLSDMSGATAVARKAYNISSNIFSTFAWVMFRPHA